MCGYQCFLAAPPVNNSDFLQVCLQQTPETSEHGAVSGKERTDGGVNTVAVSTRLSGSIPPDGTVWMQSHCLVSWTGGFSR